MIRSMLGAMFCQSCGAENAEDARFCNKCGAKIAAAGTPGGVLTPPEATVLGMGVVATDVAPAPAEQRSAQGNGVWNAQANHGPAEPTLSSVTLTGIGIQSRGRAWTFIAMASLLLVGLGAVGSFLATERTEEPGEQVDYDPAQPAEQLDIGDPLPTGVAPPAEPLAQDTATAPPPQPPQAQAPQARPRRDRPAPAASPPDSAPERPQPAPPASPPEPPAPPPVGTEQAEAERMYTQRVYFVVGRYYGSSVQRCFEAARQQHPELSGQVTMRFVVGADGRITSTSTVANTTGNAALGSCLTTQSRTWRLPAPPAAGTRVEMPFRS